jgi:hypothetical protein
VKDFLTWCKRLLLLAVLGGGPSFAWAVSAPSGALHQEAGDLLRRVQAQQQDIERLQQRVRSGPLAWPAWWGWIGGAALIGLASLAARQRRNLHDPSFIEGVVRPGPPDLGQPQAHTFPSEPVAIAEPLPTPDPVTTTEAPLVPAVAQQAPPDLSARANALLTVLGEMEFLASIGLQHGAVDVMEQHVAVTASPAPLAWLELVNLHRSEGDGAPATAVWHRVLAQLPAAALANAEALLDDTEGLEAFPSVLARVQATWNTPLAGQQVAAELMATEAPLLTLAAGRDLLWLLQVCHERASARPAPVPETEPAGEAYERTMVIGAADWVRHLEELEVAPRDQAAGVDIDLGVPGWIEEAKASVRVSDGASNASGGTPSERDALDSWRADLFDAAMGFERQWPSVRREAVSR